MYLFKRVNIGMNGRGVKKEKFISLADIIARYETYKICKAVGTQNVKTFLHLMLKLGK